VPVWCQDEAGPYQAIPQPGAGWAPEGKPGLRPHEYIRGGTAKLLTLFRPATGEVRAKGVTTAPNAVLRDIHDRMPAILSPDAERTWLDAGSTPSDLLELLTPLPDAQTALRPVGNAVNDARYDGPACLESPGQRPSGVAAGQLF